MRPSVSFLLALLVALASPAAAASAHAADGPGPGPRASALPSQSQWLADVAAKYAASRPGAYLGQRVASGDDQLAIVLDIDNTSLASHYSWPDPIKRTLKLAKRAHKLGVGVFFVTGRYQSDLGAVTPSLKAAGYSYDDICGREHGEDLVESKQRCRAKFEKQGWTFILNIGNRSTDFAGHDYERKVRLPSYSGLLS